MATATAVRTKAVEKVTRTQGDAALRRKRAQQVTMLLKQVSDSTRLQVLLLGDGERHVGALRETLNQSQPATSHHLALLRHGGLIAPRREGKNSFYGLTERDEQLASIVRKILVGRQSSFDG